jgi:hypothetical protein
MGHGHISTTMRYFHLARVSMGGIVSANDKPTAKDAVTDASPQEDSIKDKGKKKTKKTKAKRRKQTASRDTSRRGGGPRPFPAETLEEALRVANVIKQYNAGNPWPFVPGQRDRIYEVTEKGYQVAEHLRERTASGKLRVVGRAPETIDCTVSCAKISTNICCYLYVIC